VKAIPVIIGGLAAAVCFWGCGDDAPPAERLGEFLGEQQGKLAKGIGDGLDKEGEAAGKSLAKGSGKVLEGAGEGLAEGGEATGEKVAEGVGNVLKGVLKGLDKSLLQVNVELGAGLADAGMTVARGDQLINADNRPQIDVTVVLSKPFDGSLNLDLLDDKGIRLETAQAKLKGGKDETVKATFVFEAGGKAAFPGIRHVLRKS
jgi:hypothetical protein